MEATGPRSRGLEGHAHAAVAIFTGGSAVIATARALRADLQCDHNGADASLSKVTYIIPTTDNGGSTAEILRYFGGPAIGDIRNRLLRLASEHTAEARAIKSVLQLRLPGRNTSHHGCTSKETDADTDSVARSASSVLRSHLFDESTSEWQAVLDGTHPRWTSDISTEFRDTVLAFLKYFEERVRQARPSSGRDYRNGSVGNFFFTGARLSLAASLPVFCGAAWHKFHRYFGIPRVRIVRFILNSNFHKYDTRSGAASAQLQF